MDAAAAGAGGEPLATTDHPAWPAYKAALERLARAGVRMEAARMMNAPDLDDAEAAFQEAMAAYDAARERLGQPGKSLVDGAPMPRARLGPTELTFRAEAAGDDRGKAEPV